MTVTVSAGVAGRVCRRIGVIAVTGLGLLSGACAQLGSTPPQLAAAQNASANETASIAAPTDGRSELQKATEYWGEAYAKSPRDAQAAVNYARNLKALGEKRQALAVLQEASVFHANDRAINSEYGRLALEFDQVSIAQKLLERADDPTKPDWRLIAARGTVLAKQGLYRDAIPFYERALALAPDQASVLNNLALAHAMEGNADKAEPLLRRAAETGGHEARVSQNLALVLGLQGKYDEAKLAGGRDQPADNVASNVDYVRRIVKLEPKPLPAAAAPQPAPKVTAQVASKKAKPDRELKGAIIADRSEEPSSGWTTQVAASKSKP